MYHIANISEIGENEQTDTTTKLIQNEFPEKYFTISYTDQKSAIIKNCKNAGIIIQIINFAL